MEMNEAEKNVRTLNMMEYFAISTKFSVGRRNYHKSLKMKEKEAKKASDEIPIKIIKCNYYFEEKEQLPIKCILNSSTFDNVRSHSFGFGSTVIFLCFDLVIFCISEQNPNYSNKWVATRMTRNSKIRIMIIAHWAELPSRHELLLQRVNCYFLISF